MSRNGFVLGPLAVAFLRPVIDAPIITKGTAIAGGLLHKGVVINFTPWRQYRRLGLMLAWRL